MSELIKLTWSQVCAWRIAQQGLSPRLGTGGLLDGVRRTGGIHAQVMSAAELSLGVRVAGLRPEDVRSAVWESHALVRTWAMRATLHLLATQDLPLHVAARSLCQSRNWTRFFGAAGVTPAQYEAYLAAALEILSDVPITREQLAAALRERLGSPEVYALIMEGSWGTPLKPLAWGGILALGPSAGQNTTYINPRHWLPAWRDLDPREALCEIARRYLRAYGPATPATFAGWWEMHQVTAREAFRALGDEIVPVEVEGWPAYALRDTVDDLGAARSQGVVRLLPLFDAYLMGLGRGDSIAPLLEPRQYSRVFRVAGWVSAVVLVDGRVAGVWESKARRTATTVSVQMFDPPEAAIREGIAQEAERLGAFLGTTVTLQIKVD